MQLPVYVPSPEEQADPVLYASNVRNYMVCSYSCLSKVSVCYVSLCCLLQIALACTVTALQYVEILSLGIRSALQ